MEANPPVQIYNTDGSLSEARPSSKLAFNRVVISVKVGEYIEGDPYGYSDHFVEVFAYGYADENYRVVVPPIYDKAEDYTVEGLAVVQKGEFYGVIDLQGNLIVPLVYKNIYDFCEGFAAFDRNGSWGFLNTRGEEAIAPEYDHTYDFSEGLARVMKRTGKGGLDYAFGFIDTEGKLQIPIEFNQADYFSNGRTEVTKGKEKFWIDKNGNRFEE